MGITEGFMDPSAFPVPSAGQMRSAVSPSGSKWSWGPSLSRKAELEVWIQGDVCAGSAQGLGAVQSPCPARAASLSWAQEALSPALSCAELPVLRVQLPL